MFGIKIFHEKVERPLVEFLMNFLDVSFMRTIYVTFGSFYAVNVACV